MIGRAAGRTIDEESMSATRFVTHLRYLFVRLQRNAQIDHTSAELIAAIKAADPAAASITGSVAYLIEARSTTTLTPDERAYLTLHVSRLLAELPAEDPPNRPSPPKPDTQG
ncbi:PRD domain-containing protein [Propionibacterium cyclohexanicum]|uniref:PRD domain-containing protein n=1 Tax=Propionibacterium cyclohexanicum TaxID=64702 RepID=UPI0015A655C4|nr:PRD domain-containing protein [Propionibacterium cyclohexanicum]